MFNQIHEELQPLITCLGITVAKYPEFKKDDQYYPALNKELQRCQEVLEELQKLQQRYYSLPSKTRVAVWEHAGIGANSLKEMRTRITSSRETFTMLNTQMIR
jgi:hypothetical protein